MQRPIVLLVEPDDDNRAMYAEYLRNHGFEVVVAAASDDALLQVDRIDANRVDVIVTGVRLGGACDGVELVRRMRALELSVRTPIIVLTACPFERDRQRALSAGCDTFLMKPCLPETLEIEIRRLLAARRRFRTTPARARNSGKPRKPKAS